MPFFRSTSSFASAKLSANSFALCTYGSSRLVTRCPCEISIATPAVTLPGGESTRELVNELISTWTSNDGGLRDVLADVLDEVFWVLQEVAEHHVDESSQVALTERSRERNNKDSGRHF